MTEKLTYAGQADLNGKIVSTFRDSQGNLYLENRTPIEVIGPYTPPYSLYSSYPHYSYLPL